MFVWHNHSFPITQYFLHYLWAPYLSSGVVIFFFLVLKLTKPSEKKKKVKRWSKVTAEYYLWVPYVCLITILLLSYELWKLKTHLFG